ncbi:uncharacterized protein PITG_00114 [Phytophthora infestans T30-4]|uniref:EF-hand domain-containing protein n=1 Tax=Phytophthora infestans (strain T30-4) TaxID=403677 RepID=D0MSX2_PHYIT|nr:uncharacterized protein PITG_00114 [Phytophthora infestans T30-4]EEY57556.1 conserved hypothetical protein [Phytophthora infestans T30-4]|eukprot:XP_002908742.1 conserved hypothetical protein [Phytophthora infestans T30-4]
MLFRDALADCSGEIDADEVADMLETIFAQSGAAKQGEIHKYVEEFMRVVNKDNSGLVSFEEFVEALENGLKIEVEVYTPCRPKASALVARPEHGLAAINANEDDAGDASENDESKVVDRMSTIREPRCLSAAASSAPAMCREHDVLNVEEFFGSDIAAQMKTAYEFLLLNCLVSGAEGIAKSLIEMAEIVVAS